MRRHPVVVGAVIALIVVAVGVTWIAFEVNSPGPASVGDALDRFREEGDDDPADTSAARPPEGVYLYEGSGRESLSFPPLTQRDGDEMPATVTHGADGCWTTRVDFNAKHWQAWNYCRVEGAMVETGGSNGQEWDLGVTSVGNTANFTCDPPSAVLVPGAQAGDENDHSCSGTSTAIEGETTSAGISRFLGVETLVIGGTEVETLHVRGVRTLTGSQDGDERTDSWFRADGLLVRYERDIEVRSDSPIGAITYTEQGQLTLTDLEPRR